MQVYWNGKDEHYIDLACPFGKTNSPLEFCPPVSLLAKLAAQRYALTWQTEAPILGSHVDDIFGGFQSNDSYEKALHFRNYMCSTGSSLTVQFNMKATKTPLPSRRQVILGCLWDSTDKHVRTSEKKRSKYMSRIDELLRASVVTVEDLLKIHGNLNYAAEVSPFGRPFLAPIMNRTAGLQKKDLVVLSTIDKMCLRV